MKTNKLKILSIAVCCFVIALCSGSQGMDNLTGIEEKKGIDPTRMQVSSQNESHVLDFEAKPFHTINIQDDSPSMASYLFSQLESTSKLVNELTNLTMNHPGLAFALCFAYVAPIAAALCECYTCEQFTTDGKECTTWIARIGVTRVLSRSPAECSRYNQNSNHTLCIPYPK